MTDEVQKLLDQHNQQHQHVVCEDANTAQDIYGIGDNIENQVRKLARWGGAIGYSLPSGVNVADLLLAALAGDNTANFRVTGLKGCPQCIRASAIVAENIAQGLHAIADKLDKMEPAK